MDELDAFEEECGRKPERCWEKVMQHWLEGRTEGIHSYPRTWEGLYEMLRDLECCEVAEGLQDAVKSAFS